MIHFLMGVVLAVCGLILLYLHRVLRGPTVFDRLLGLNGISTKILVVLVLVGELYGRVDMFIDIALAYGLINLVGTLTAAKFVERKGMN